MNNADYPARIAAVLHSREQSLPWRRKAVQRHLKRAFDFLLALLICLVVAPLFVVLAVLVKVTSQGPVLFVQTRLGLGGQTYRMFKFRSMKVLPVGHEAAVAGEVTASDARLTPIGAWLRASRLDELPQLFQVISGTMSLVGPRPDVEQNLPLYSDEQMLRFAMPPGCTAWTATRGMFRNDWHTRQNINVEYVQQWSLWLDVRILVESVLVVLLQRDTTPVTDASEQYLQGRSATQARTKSE